MPKNRDHFIQVDKDLMDDPLLLEAATRLYCDESNELCHVGGEKLSEDEGMKLSRARYVSALLRLWCYADTYIREDDTLPLGEIALDQYVGLCGFCKLSPPEWLEILPDDRVRLPGYCEKNDIVGRRERKAQRAAYMREWRDLSRDNHATPTGQSRRKHVPLNTYTYTNTKKENPSLRSGQKKATRLPPDWPLTPELKAIAEAEALTDIDTVHAMFVDHWLAATDKQGRKMDWTATWRNWCRREAGYRRERAQQQQARATATNARPIRHTQESALAAIEAANRMSERLNKDDDDNQGLIRLIIED